MLKELQDLGLSTKESEIYYELSKEKESTANRLSKLTNTNRTVTYNILQNLIKKGLISFFIRNNKRIYNISSYDNLLTKIKEKEFLAKQVISNLKKIKTSKNEENKIEIFEGIEGLKTIHKEMLKTKELRILNATGLIEEKLKYSKGWFKELARNKIKIIANKNFKFPKKYKKVKLKYLKNSKTNYATTFIFNDIIIIQVIKEEPLIVKIKNKYLAEGYKTNFDFLWNNL